jgi:hypothetical protein
MHPPHVSRPFGPTLPWLGKLISFAAALACSSSLENTSSGPDTVPSPTANAPASGGSGSAGTVAGGGSALVTAPTPATEGQSTAPITPPVAPVTPASTDTASVGDVCAALGSDDACASCVCGACKSELDVCADTPGCAEILACVRENGCSGIDCYCGDALLTACVRGNGNGPCKAVVLAAPGGKEPSLADPSAGPASDAAVGVADCADDRDTCGNTCDIGG